MQQRREPRSLVCSCHFTHTRQRTERAWSGAVSGTRFAWPCSVGSSLPSPTSATADAVLFGRFCRYDKTIRRGTGRRQCRRPRWRSPRRHAPHHGGRAGGGRVGAVSGDDLVGDGTHGCLRRSLVQYQCCDCPTQLRSPTTGRHPRSPHPQPRTRHRRPPAETPTPRQGTHCNPRSHCVVAALGRSPGSETPVTSATKPSPCRPRRRFPSAPSTMSSTAGSTTVNNRAHHHLRGRFPSDRPASITRRVSPPAPMEPSGVGWSGEQAGA
jgi:hypothetical protein